jgi:S1-C subfamily serine protease
VPRLTPRGALAADELATIDMFKRLSPSVVHITTLAIERDFFNRPVQQVPRGTGTGFIWDNSGHVVTNFHVSATGPCEPTRTTYDAEVGASPTATSPCCDRRRGLRRSRWAAAAPLVGSGVRD